MEIILPILFAAPVCALFIGALLQRPWRVPALLAVLIAPLVIYTLWLAASPASPPGFWQWWWVGLLYLAIPYLICVTATLAFFFLGTAFARNAGRR